MNKNEKHVPFCKFNFGLTSFCETTHSFKELWLEFTKTINKEIRITNKKETFQIPSHHHRDPRPLFLYILHISKLVSSDFLEAYKIYGRYKSYGEASSLT